MASSSSLFLVFLVTLTIAAGAMNKYKVGDTDGWCVPADNDPGFYETWASKIKFLVGDSIVFQYKNDSVVMVSKRGYYHCNETSHGSLPKDGNTVFLLDKPGFYYYVSGDTEHCKKGQRLMVEVIGVPLPPLVPAPSPQPSAAVLGTTVSPLVTAVGLGCLSLGLIHCLGLV